MNFPNTSAAEFFSSGGVIIGIAIITERHSLDVYKAIMFARFNRTYSQEHKTYKCHLEPRDDPCGYRCEGRRQDIEPDEDCTTRVMRLYGRLT